MIQCEIGHEVSHVTCHVVFALCCTFASRAIDYQVVYVRVIDRDIITTLNNIAR